MDNRVYPHGTKSSKEGPNKVFSACMKDFLSLDFLVLKANCETQVKLFEPLFQSKPI